MVEKRKNNKLANSQVKESWERLAREKPTRDALLAQLLLATGVAIHWTQLVRHAREDHDPPLNLGEVCVGGRATGHVARSDRARSLAEQLLNLVEELDGIVEYMQRGLSIKTVDRDLLRKIANVRKVAAKGPNLFGGDES